MKQIEYSQIAQSISKGDVNFIAFVMTPWHLIGAKAAIEYVKQQGIDVNPVIISQPHPETGYSVTKDDEYDIYQLKNLYARTPLLGYLSFLTWCWRTASNSKVELYFANAWYGRFKKLFWILSSVRKIFKIIIFEEGIGSYFKEHYKVDSTLYKRNFFQKLQARVDLCMTKRYLETGRLVNLNPLKYGKDEKLMLNDKAIEAYKKVLGTKPLNLDERKVVFLTQELDEEIYRVVNLVTQQLVSSSYEVYIKAHPRMPIDKTKLECKVNLIEHGVAIESVLQTLGTKYVISFNTTSLLSLSYLYGVTSISLLHLVREDCCNGLFDTNGDFNHWFEKTCSNIVKFPNSMDAFIAVMEDKEV